MYHFLSIASCLAFTLLSIPIKPNRSSTAIPNKQLSDTTLFNNYLQKAVTYSSLNEDSSQWYGQKALELGKVLEYSKGLSKYFHFLTAHYNKHSQYDSAMQSVRKELYWAKKSKDSIRLAWAYNALANVYEYQGNIDSPAFYFLKALEILPDSKAQKLYGTLNYNLASALYLTEEYKAALMYAKKGYAVGKMRRDTHMMSNSLLDIGSILVGLNKFDSAFLCFEKAIKMVEHTPDSLSIMDALNNEGDLLAKEKKYYRALTKYQKMLQLALHSRNNYYLLYAYGNTGITQFQLKDYDQAEKNLNKAVSIALQIHSRNELKQFYDALSNVKEAQKQFASALQYRKKYDSLNNILRSESAEHNMHQLEVKYQSLQKDKQITQQNLILTRKQHAIERKNKWIFIFLGGFIALIIIFLFSIRNYRHKKKLQEQSFLILQKQQEVSTLHTKMEVREEERNRIGKEMHDDIGSALTTILYLSEDLKRQSTALGKQTAKRITHTARSVVDKMNEIIWSMNKDYDTLDDLMVYTRQHAADLLDNYHIKYHFEIPKSESDVHLQGEQRRNIYLSIMEALHNVIKHAQATEVSVSFCLKNDLTIIIQDNGKGIDFNQPKRFGNGLKNMEQRMKSVNGFFEIKNNKGSRITLQCPLEYRNSM